MTTANIVEAKERQKLVDKEYKFNFLDDIEPLKWPERHERAFKHIQQYEQAHFDTWQEEILANWRDQPWKLEIRKRVEYLVDIARDSSRDRSNEKGWRTKLEPIIFERFEKDVSW
jgi:hypothetical protein